LTYTRPSRKGEFPAGLHGAVGALVPVRVVPGRRLFTQGCLNPSHLFVVGRGRSQCCNRGPIALADGAHEHRDVVDLDLRDSINELVEVASSQ
jgi:hypothetical protein